MHLIMFYTILHGGVDIDEKDQIVQMKKPPVRGLQHQYFYTIPRTSNDYHTHSFYPQTIFQWNILPEEVVCALTLTTFKSQLSKHRA